MGYIYSSLEVSEESDRGCNEKTKLKTKFDELINIIFFNAAFYILQFQLNNIYETG